MSEMTVTSLASLPEFWRQVLGDALALLPHSVLAPVPVDEKLSLVECLLSGIEICDEDLEATRLRLLDEIGDLLDDVLALHSGVGIDRDDCAEVSA